MSAFGLRMAHKCAVRLLDRSQAVCELLNVLRAHTLRPEDRKRVHELTELRDRLRDCRDEAEKKVEPQLLEFACVHDEPLDINGFTVASAHKAALMVADWVAEPDLAADRMGAFLDQFYEEAKGRVDWDTVHKQRHPIVRSFLECDAHDEWAEHQAMLEIELARALRLPPIKRVEPKLTEKEQEIVMALGYETMSYKQLAERVGATPNSEWRKKLADLGRRGVVEHGEGGYSLGPLLS